MRLLHLRKVFIFAVLAAVTATGAVAATNGPAQAASPGDRLTPGDVLTPGDSLDSFSATYRLVMREDGNLVESDPDGQVIWQTSTDSPGASLLDAPDGNLVLQAPDGATVWSTTYDPTRGPSTVIIDDEGILTDQADSGSVLWVNYATPGGPLTPADGAALYAQHQLGRPYVYGTAGPDTFDNSGLTLAAWAVAGVPLPHNALAQLAATTPIDRDQLQTGDLVFYADGSRVAIYIGNDRVIQSPHTGAAVSTASIDASPVFAYGRVA